MKASIPQLLVVFLLMEHSLYLLMLAEFPLSFFPSSLNGTPVVHASDPWNLVLLSFVDLQLT